jgi:hypothetical protein
MMSWIDEAIKEEQRQDMLRDAAHRRLVIKARMADRQPERRYSQALVWLGRWLETLGCRLQARYGVLAEAGVVRPVGDRAGQC